MIALEQEGKICVPPRYAAPRLLNLGCGARPDARWTNVDLHPRSAGVRQCDVLAGPLPFADASFDAVYHAHLLEHLPAERAAEFLRECRRLLRSGGVVRVVVPDLEQIARFYLQALEQARSGDDAGAARHAWFTLELLDQLTREREGGQMLAQLARVEAGGEAWRRVGAEAASLRARLAASRQQPPSWWASQRRRVVGWLFGSWRERLIRWLLGAEYEALQVGRFRRSGEVHHWMYDRVSLATLLAEAGFTQIRVVAAGESAIPDWPAYELDTFADGTPTKPDSLYMEAVRA